MGLVTKGACLKHSQSPRFTSLRLASITAQERSRQLLVWTVFPLRVIPWPTAPKNNSRVAGLQMPPAIDLPFYTQPTETHHSGIPATNSRVPSNGSTIQTRS